MGVIILNGFKVCVFIIINVIYEINVRILFWFVFNVFWFIVSIKEKGKI